MVTTVTWTRKALTRFREMLDYLENEGAHQAAENLTANTLKRIEVLKKYPEMGRLAKKGSTIRFVSIGQHKIMFYRMHGSKMFISNFFDERQDPRKRPY